MTAQSNYSGSPLTELETVELSDGETVLRYVMNHSDVVAEGMTFTALPMDPDSLPDPPQDDDGSQEITVVLDNVDGVLAVFAYNIKKNNLSATMTRRTYLSSDLTAPYKPSYTMQIKSAAYDIMSASFTCGYMNVLDAAWQRRTYNTNDFPGIEFL